MQVDPHIHSELREELQEWCTRPASQRKKGDQTRQLLSKYPLGKHTGETYTDPVTGHLRLKADIGEDNLRQLKQEQELWQEILAQVSFAFFSELFRK